MARRRKHGRGDPMHEENGLIRPWNIGNRNGNSCRGGQETGRHAHGSPEPTGGNLAQQIRPPVVGQEIPALLPIRRARTGDVGRALPTQRPVAPIPAYRGHGSGCAPGDRVSSMTPPRRAREGRHRARKAILRESSATRRAWPAQGRGGGPIRRTIGKLHCRRQFFLAHDSEDCIVGQPGYHKSQRADARSVAGSRMPL